MPTQHAPVPCPVCAAPCDGPPLHVYTAERAAAHFCPQHRSPDRHARLLACIRRLWKGDSSRVLVCPSCGFGFGDPFVGGDEEFYAILHEMAGYPGERWEYGLARSVLSKELPHGGSALDFGAGDGVWLKALPPQFKRFATEGSASNRARLEKEGITVFADLRDAAREHPGTFNVITAFQVIEHIAEFRPVFQTMHTCLAPGGWVILSVPSLPENDLRERITGSPDMMPNHINKWTDKSLRLALEQAGFVTRRSEMEPASRAALLWGIHQRLVSDSSTKPNSISAMIYRIQSNGPRRLLLKAWAPIIALRLLPHYTALKMSGNLFIAAQKQ